MARHTMRKYIPGDHLVICDRCGFKRYRSDCKKEWQGWLVCADTCWEPRHPQDLTPPYRLDRQWVEDNRPRQPTVTTVTRSFVSQDFTTFSETDGFNRMTVAAGQVDLEVEPVAGNAKLTRFYGQEFFQDFRLRFTLQSTGNSVSDPGRAALVVGEVDDYGGGFYNIANMPSGGRSAGCGMVCSIGPSTLTIQLFESDGRGNDRLLDANQIVLAAATDYYFELKRVNRTLTAERYADDTYAAVAESLTGDQLYYKWHDYLIWPSTIQSKEIISDTLILTVKDLAIEIEALDPITGDDL